MVIHSNGLPEVNPPKIFSDCIIEEEYVRSLRLKQENDRQLCFTDYVHEFNHFNKKTCVNLPRWSFQMSRMHQFTPLHKDKISYLSFYSTGAQ